ncbi:MAG: glycosyltransferase [Clostridiales bacterium]|nr:glycosyltransferase [Clostridiales bacterium]
MTIINKVITVIVSVYKVEKYLDRCVESIVNQTYKNLEIILVDDGSPDNCPKMCDEWVKRDSRIKVIHKENGGVSSARNAGLDVASGEYIAFVDSVDWLKDDMYEYLIHLLQEYNAQISCASYYTVNEDMNIDEKLLQEEISVYNYNDIIKNITKPFAFSIWNKLYSKKLFECLPPLPENLSLSEDIMLNYFLYKNTDKLVLSNLPKYYYFRHCESAISGRIKYLLIDDSFKALTIVDNDFDKSSEVYPYFLSFENCKCKLNTSDFRIKV